MNHNEFANMFIYGKPMNKILKLLLKDRTTGRNIVWATDTYEKYGAFYHKERQMFPDFNINLIMDGILLPRIMKSKDQQKERTKAKAEVFTASWIANAMNNLTDDQWFGRTGVFNTENKDHTWTVNSEKVMFGPQQSKRFQEWQRYVDARKMEMACGEAPYLVSRYDTTTGEAIPVPERIGLLDRKLRIVNENAESKEEWLKWAYRAFESTYGFEYQGDNLFFARVNLVQTFADYYKERFGQDPDMAMIRHIAVIVSWNLWQMNGMTDMPPFGVPVDEYRQLTIFDVDSESIENNRPVYCKIRDWRSQKTLEYRSLKTTESRVKTA